MSRNSIGSYLEAEVRCYHCGHTSGVIQRSQDVLEAPIVFKSADGETTVNIRNLAELRCARCRGSVYIEEFETRYVYPKVDFLDEDRPRRGRPPKRLVELRRAQEAALKSA
jgi:hypothetical protein